MNPAVVLVSSLYDFSTDEVAHALEVEGVDFVRLNREQMADHRLTLDPLEPCLTVDGPTGTHRIGPNLRSIWYRQPVFLRNPTPVALTPSEQLKRSQWQAFRQALSVFRHASWMNSPAATYQAESKPFQLMIANRCGFRIPRSIVSNDASSIRAGFSDDVAIKSLDTAFMREHEDVLFAYTTIAASDTLSAEAFRDVPVIAQQALIEKVDVRVTVVGDSLFAVHVLSDGEPIAGDWRRTRKERLSYVDVALPAKIQAACRRMLQELGLNFGAIDLAETPTGTYFIEINPTGEWGWLSTEARPIGLTIAEWLAHPPRA